MDGRFATISVDSRTLLRRGGFTGVREALRLSPTELSKELNIDLPTAYKLLDELRGGSGATSSGRLSTHSVAPRTRNALEIIQSLQNSGVRHVTTSCRPLDKILAGGFARGALTELCGAPGTGKTQLCIQTAVCANIPEFFGGVGGGAVYLDTEGSFSPQRAFEMADALSSHLQTTLGDQEEGSSRTMPTRDQMLDNIHVCRAHDCGEQLAFVQCLPMFLRAHPEVKVVIVDSVAHHFRHDFPDMSQRGKVLARHAHALNAVARDFDVVVIVTNHMTTRGDHGLVPALGEHWFHGITNRIVLTKLDETVEWAHPKKREMRMQVPLRRAEIVKAASLESASAEFVVVTIGIRAYRPPKQPVASNSFTDASEPISKRPKHE